MKKTKTHKFSNILNSKEICILIDEFNEKELEKFLHKELTHYSGYSNEWTVKTGCYLNIPQKNVGAHSSSHIYPECKLITFEEFRNLFYKTRFKFLV